MFIVIYKYSSMAYPTKFKSLICPTDFDLRGLNTGQQAKPEVRYERVIWSKRPYLKRFQDRNIRRFTQP